MGLFGSSGVRDIVSRGFLRLAFEVGFAVGNLYPSVIVGCDTRTSSDAMKHSFLSGLLAAGARAYDAGTVPTPALAYAARAFACGAMITASHNPPQYNGIKLLNPDGSAFDRAQREQIEGGLGRFEMPSWDRLEKGREAAPSLEGYLERLRRDFPSRLEVKVVVDCGCGAASLVTPYLLRGLGCRVVGLDCYPSGHYPRGIEPTPENLGTLMEVVKATGADLGIAHDGDGDRVAAVDEEGSPVSGDRLLALLASRLGAKKVVTTVEASQALEGMGFEVTRTRVGDPFVSEALRGGGDFGGEPSGAFIFPGLSYCPDGIYAAAKMAEIACGGRLSAQLEGIPSYPMLRGAISGDRAIMGSLEERLARVEGASVSRVDGIRLTFEEGWLLVRPSGTEPKIRLTAEAKTKARAEELYHLGAEAVKECLKG